MTSAEKPDGIASQAFTTALPEAHTFLTLLVVMDRVSSVVSFDAGPVADRPLDAHFADADFARGRTIAAPVSSGKGTAFLRHRPAFSARYRPESAPDRSCLRH